MPRDDWAKYARRDRGRKALQSGEAFVTSCNGLVRTRRRKSRRKAKKRKAECRACLRTMHLGREDICLACYKRFGAQVHAVAFRRSGPLNRSAASRVEANSRQTKAAPSEPGSEMTHTTPESIRQS